MSNNGSSYIYVSNPVPMPLAIKNFNPKKFEKLTAGQRIELMHKFYSQNASTCSEY